MEQQNTDRQAIQEEEQVISSEKLQQAVDTVNEFLQVNHSASKFVLHEGLERYFVQVVDAETEEVVKEIPPRKLLDAFYEMQKLLGMIVDEKI
ncbi:flagellar protein FlaG [Lysinibacillus sp. TE18511]